MGAIERGIHSRQHVAPHSKHPPKCPSTPLVLSAFLYDFPDFKMHSVVRGEGGGPHSEREREQQYNMSIVCVYADRVGVRGWEASAERRL